MKGFWRTVAGKTVLYCVSILMLIIAILSAAGIYEIADMDMYVKSKEQVLYQALGREVEEQSFYIINQYEEGSISGKQPKDSNLVYQLYDNEGNLVVWTDNFGAATDMEYCLVHGWGVDGSKTYTFKAKVYGLSVDDEFKITSRIYEIAYDLRFIVIAVFFVSALLFISCVIALINVAGRRKEDDDIHPGTFTHIPFDLFCVISLAVLIAIAGAITLITYEGDVAASIVVIVVALFAPIFFMDFAIRIKQKNLIKGMIICKLGKLLLNLFRNIPLVWRTAVILFIINFFELIVVFIDPGVGLLFVAIEKSIGIPLILYVAIMMRKLQKQGKLLAEGDFEAKVDTKGLIWDFKTHGNNLNSIAIGMNKAVDAKLKSERMKTELITNVSHDIKTPLTSIINYCTLIEGEKTDNEKINEYTEVVIRQSNKLKRLIENLVEASKASTGNLEVSLMECDAGMFVSQCSGEYDDKLENNKLTLVTKIADENLKINADGKHMWRVFDNLMNNICKYSLEGTRVFLTLEEVDDKAEFTFKNISKEPLDVSEEELMERFVRGDSSRNTEGNGLGLSIARSLTEIQGGTLNIDIDGDFFKAILKFPLVNN